MKAITARKYGQSDVMVREEIPKPTPRDNEVLIKIAAVSLNASDWEFLTGSPAYIRLFSPFKPGATVLGSDIAGHIEAIGKNVTGFKPGDAVLCDLFMTSGEMAWGGLAEYVCAPQEKLVHKPHDISFAQGATLLQAATVALQGLRDKGQIKARQDILIIGAGGGAGTFAIQLAKLNGAQVTGLDSAAKQGLMRSIGADHTIDYATTDFTKTGQTYDLILDLVASKSLFACKRALKPHGKYVLVGGSLGAILRAVIFGPLIWKFTSNQMGLLLHKQNRSDITQMIELCQSGKVTPIIDKCYPLEQSAQAMQRLGDGGALGKIIVEIGDQKPSS